MSPFQIEAKRLEIDENANSGPFENSLAGYELEVMSWTIIQLLPKPQMSE